MATMVQRTVNRLNTSRGAKTMEGRCSHTDRRGGAGNAHNEVSLYLSRLRNRVQKPLPDHDVCVLHMRIESYQTSMQRARRSDPSRSEEFTYATGARA